DDLVTGVQTCALPILRRLAAGVRACGGGGFVPLYVLYVDESGVPERRMGQTTHYALAGIAIPASTWAAKRRQVVALRSKYGFGKDRKSTRLNSSHQII